MGGKTKGSFKKGNKVRLKVTDQEIKDAYTEARGNLQAAARLLGVVPGTLYDRMKANEELRDHLEHSRELMLDSLEDELYSQALDGNTTALIFALKTQGRYRGYAQGYDVNLVSKQEHTVRFERDAKRDAEHILAVRAELDRLSSPDSNLLPAGSTEALVGIFEEIETDQEAEIEDAD